MKATVIRYQTRDAEAADTNQRMVEAVFAELAERLPDDVRYAVFRFADGVTFLHVVAESDGLADLTAFKEFQAGVGDRIDGRPVAAEATLIGSYRLVAD
ncbi:hypothetical protein ACFQV2_21760 [Actinokineospora soli]|uniref:Quinol monooxygenase YgiN n=1 Tax=Actinokineospora soli TaxID=1048753 RepID=A0ABW2TPJ5_9PSEU